MSKGEHSAEHGYEPLWRSAEHGFTSWRRSAEHGFTLIEMLVALAIFGLAAMALVRLEALTLRTTASVVERTYAQVTLDNLAVTLLTDPRAPTVGHADGQVANAGRNWRWAREVKRTDDANFVRIDLALTDDAGRPAGALSLARPVQ